ncbi:hypothetical protein VNO77_46330 [Canavalia gladiata]|uniref:Uncharacterized protein n=1 Tax=Canavalia gladiata TaxID=3824 RepID=A0AAN9PGY3_CANGL
MLQQEPKLPGPGKKKNRLEEEAVTGSLELWEDVRVFLLISEPRVKKQGKAKEGYLSSLGTYSVGFPALPCLSSAHSRLSSSTSSEL